jgi:hypothetical protein
MSSDRRVLGTRLASSRTVAAATDFPRRRQGGPKCRDDAVARKGGTSMTKLRSLALAFSTILLALPVMASGRPGPEVTTHAVAGDVVWATPVAFTIDTGRSFRSFLIPPGVGLSGELAPGEQVRVGWVYEPTGSAHAVVRETAPVRVAARAAVVPEESVTGTIAFITPQDLALETDYGIKLMALAPDSTLSDRLAEGEYVRVWYRVEPETGNRIIHRAAVTLPSGVRAVARTVASTQPERPRSVAGEIEWETPDRLVLDTDHGLEEFLVRHPSRISDLGRGDYVRVTYRPARNSGAGVPIADDLAPVG